MPRSSSPTKGCEGSAASPRKRRSQPTTQPGGHCKHTRRVPATAPADIECRMALRRRDWLLAFMAATPAAAPQPIQTPEQSKSLDPIRIMKGMFLFQHEDPSGAADQLAGAPYDFEPYAYGPFTAAIYHDLNELGGLGYVKADPVADRTYARWSVTSTGLAHASVKVEEISPERLERLRHAKHVVSSRGFAALLRYVYSRHPAYATESVAKL